MLACRFCGARLDETALPFECPLCGQRNEPELAPVELSWAGEGFVWPATGCRLPFASAVVVERGQCALVRLEGRDEILEPGRHPIYPADPQAARVAFMNTLWQSVKGQLRRVLPWQEASWELRVGYSLEARITGPEALEEYMPFEAGANARVTARIDSALEAMLTSALDGLCPHEREGRDALALRVDTALAGLDAPALDSHLSRWRLFETRQLRMWRELLASEDPNGEPCPECGRRNARADGINATCAFCGARLFWCPNCLKHVVRVDDRWCHACRGRLYA